MELNKKEKRLLLKLEKMNKRKKQWYFAIILGLFTSIICLLAFILIRENECLLVSLFVFFTSLYALETLRTAQLLEKIKLSNNRRVKESVPDSDFAPRSEK